MADIFAYLYGFGAGGDFTKSIIIVTAPTGSTVTCTKGTTVKTATEKNGEWWFKNLDIGTWTLKATLSGQTATQTVNVTQFDVYRVAMVYRVTPEFTYTGDYEIVDDADNPISDFASWKGNWKIRLLTSGTLTFTNLIGAEGGIDVFLVGGGGAGGILSYSPGTSAGGGGGYTKTISAAALSVNTPMNVHIGAGGTSPGGDGGTTSFGSYTVSGGGGGSTTNHRGGSGGSGGSSPTYSSGGTDGSNGYGEMPGTGQGSTTREFGQSGGKLYSTGGGGGQNPAIAGGENTGDGGDGAANRQSGAAGGAGIVILRNAR